MTKTKKWIDEYGYTPTCSWCNGPHVGDDCTSTTETCMTCGFDRTKHHENCGCSRCTAREDGIPIAFIEEEIAQLKLVETHATTAEAKSVGRNARIILESLIEAHRRHPWKTKS